MTSSPCERVFVVTGAAGGIGEAVVRRLAAPGVGLVLADVGADVEGFGTNAKAVADIAKQAEQRGAAVIAQAVDVSEPEASSGLVDAATAAWDRLDGVIACAGIHRERSMLEWSDDDAEAALRIGLLAPMRLAAKAARAMVSRKAGGSLVVFGAPSGAFGAARQGLMGAASGGLMSFVRSAAVEWKRHRIRVNAVVPTARTRQTSALPLFQSIQPDAMSPDAVARVVEFLVGADSEDVSGEVLGVAGPRVYALRARETSGAFFESEQFDVRDIAVRWREIVR